MRRLFTLLLTLFFICAIANAESIWVTCEGPGYDTPDEAARAYVEAMNAGDMNTLVATFAVETYVDHMDAMASLERMKVFNTSMYYSVPVAGPLTRGILIERRRNEITQLIYNAWLLNATQNTDYEDAGSGGMVKMEDSASIEAFLSVLNASPMEQMVGHITVTAVCAPNNPLISKYMPANLNSEKVQQNMAQQLTNCGGDEFAERIVILDVDGAMGVQFMQCVRYGEKWYNYRTQSMIATMLGLEVLSNGLVVGDALAGFLG